MKLFSNASVVQILCNEDFLPWSALLGDWLNRKSSFIFKQLTHEPVKRTAEIFWFPVDRIWIQLS